MLAKIFYAVLISASGTCLLHARQPACGSEQTTADMLNCANSRYAKAQREMNAAYEKLRSRLDSTGKRKLEAAQTAWLSFRKSDAEFMADGARGGTMAPLIATTVSADMTEARTKELLKSLQTE